MPPQSQVVGGLSCVYVKPCLGNVECQGNKADNGTGSVLSISLVGLGVFFQGGTSSALLPVLCLLSPLWLPPFILFLIRFPFCLHVPLAFQLFFWNLFFPDPAPLFSLRNKNLVLITIYLPLCQTALQAEAAGQPTEKLFLGQVPTSHPPAMTGRKGSLGIKQGCQAIGAMDCWLSQNEVWTGRCWLRSPKRSLKKFHLSKKGKRQSTNITNLYEINWMESLICYMGLL